MPKLGHGYFGDRVQCGPGQVEPGRTPLGIKDFGLQSGEDPEVLRVALEPAERFGDLVEGTLAVVPVGRVADVVGQAGQVDQVGIAAEPDRHAASDLGHLSEWVKPGARGVTVPRTDHLGLVG